MDQLSRSGKRELICLLLFTCNHVVSIGEVSSSAGRLGWATLFYCATPRAFHIVILFQEIMKTQRLVVHWSLTMLTILHDHRDSASSHCLYSTALRR